MEKKSYYAIIPADVRYDDRLKLLSRMLYGEITALCNERGFCWASNSYFANLYKSSIRTIKSCISQLRDLGYITVELKYGKDTKEVEQRFIRIANQSGEEIFTTYSQNFHHPREEIFTTPGEENCTDNNTLFNNTFNNTSNISGQFIPPSVEEVREYCKSRNNSIDAETFVDFYTSKGWLVGRAKMKDWKAAVRTWERNRQPNNSSSKPQEKEMTYEEKLLEIERKRKEREEKEEFEKQQMIERLRAQGNWID